MLLFVLAGAAHAQVPNGTIAGVVRDPAQAAVSGAHVTIVNLATNFGREQTSAEHGDYSFPMLAPGEYEISVEAPRFQRVLRRATVETGMTVTVEFELQIGSVTESLTVDTASPQIRYDSHSVGGTITAGEIGNLPLNGRNFLELAKLEPGVQPPTHTSGNRMLIPVLGAPGGPSGRGARVTVDGGSVMAVSQFGAAMGFSQEVVQEFRISTANFDLSTGLTFAGAINVTTRSGGNDLHGSAFYFFRDHKMSAYPGLRRDPADPDPFFQRRQFGFAAGGPIRKGRLFFFGNWERTEQRGVATTTLAGPDFGHLSRITPSPLFGDQLSFRLDDRLSSRHTAFVRYAHDGSRSFANTTGTATTVASALPSNWVRELTWVDQSVLGVTSVLRPTLVNDFRFSYFFFSDDQLPPQESDCPGCLGIGAPMISVPQAGLVLGQSGITLYPGRRFEWNDSVAWQKGTHRARFGATWEHNRGGAMSWASEPASLTLFSPDQVRSFNQSPQTPPQLRIPLPAAFNSLNDILQLPLQSITVGFGDPRTRQDNGSLVRTWDTLRFDFQDTWRAHERLTLNYGLAWMMDGYKNYDLSKPEYLAPVLGRDGLGPTRRQWKNFSPSLGLAWTPSGDKKTVIHAGAGIYYDFFFQNQIDTERAILGPPGTGRQTVSGAGIANTLSGIPGFPVGTPLNITGSPTLFTGANAMLVLPSVRAGLVTSLANADQSLRSVEITKQVPGIIFPADVPSWSSQHVSAGFQRQLTRNFVLSADFVFRHFIHGGLGPNGLDLNHFNSVRGPVIPRCTSAAQQNDPRAACSAGPINVWQSTSNQTYKGLLLRADKRFSRHFQMLGSYAWSSNTGTPGTGVNNPATAFSPTGLNLDYWHQPSRPLVTDYPHIVNVAGVVELPLHLDLGLNFSFSSSPPFSPTVGTGPTGIDFNGDGTTGDLLPGTQLAQFNRGSGKADLAGLVSEFNATYSGTLDSHGRNIPSITLPADYSMDHNFQALDLRLSRTFVLLEPMRLSLIGEVFNLYNAANLSGYSPDLTSAAFGQPQARFTQLFGSGGPRAFQVAARIAF
jgi:hypothetical protein